MFQYLYCPECGTKTVEKWVDGVSRKACSRADCDFVHFDNPTPVVAALIEYQGKAFIARNARWPEGMFGLVAGFLEKGETPKQGIIREIGEETQLHTDQLQLIGHYSFFEQNQILFVYHAQCSGNIELEEELAEYRLVSYEKLQPWPKGTGPAVRDWLMSKGYLNESSDD